MIITPGFIGIDISKHHLDLFDSGCGRSERVANGSEAIAALVERLRGRDVFVLFEATGRYDAALRRALAAAAIRFARVNPARARDFARATGVLAKTDRIDARVLAAMAQSLAPAPAQQDCPEREALLAAHRRRDQLVQQRQQERARRSECADPDLLADIEAHLDWLDRRIAAWDAVIRDRIAASHRLQRHARLLRSIPGFGPVATATLLALMPELGELAPGKIAALAGLAPFNVDSGQSRGTRRIKAGRKRVRDALYMAALAAGRANPRFHTFYRRLRDAGKPAKLALIALARKLLIVANAVLRTQTQFR
jgi:transposase